MHFNRRFANLIKTVLCVLMLAACQDSNRQTAWREEVVLGSGERLTAYRTTSAITGGELGGGADIKDIRMTLSIESKNRPGLPGVWDYSTATPLLIDFDESRKEWFIVATFLMCSDWKRLGKPRLPYIEYRYQNGQWHRGDLSEDLLGRPTNLLYFPKLSVEEVYVTAAEREVRNRVFSEKTTKIISHWDNYCSE